MKTYPVQDRVDMILVLSECLLSPIVYAQKYPNRNHPERRLFEKLIQQFRQTGSLAYGIPNRQNEITENEENAFEVIHTQTDISRQNSGRIIQEHRFILVTFRYTKNEF